MEAVADAVLAILEQPLEPDRRRHLAVASEAALYAGAGMDLEARERCCGRQRDAGSGRSRGSRGALLARAERRGDRGDAGSGRCGAPHPGAEEANGSARAPSSTCATQALPVAGPEPGGGLRLACPHVINRLLPVGGGHGEVRVHDALGRVCAEALARRAMERGNA